MHWPILKLGPELLFRSLQPGLFIDGKPPKFFTTVFPSQPATAERTYLQRGKSWNSDAELGLILRPTVRQYLARQSVSQLGFSPPSRLTAFFYVPSPIHQTQTSFLEGARSHTQ